MLLRLPTNPLGILIYLIGLAVLWMVVSVPVYFAGRAVKGHEARFGDAMGATLGGVVAYYAVFFIAAFFLGPVIGPSAPALGLVLGLLAWLSVFRAAFDTTWLGAVGIVILAWVILIVLDFALVALFGVRFPDFFPF